MQMKMIIAYRDSKKLQQPLIMWDQYRRYFQAKRRRQNLLKVEDTAHHNTTKYILSQYLNLISTFILTVYHILININLFFVFFFFVDIL